jgi:hypothetical protein
VGHSGNLSKLEYKTYRDEAEPLVNVPDADLFDGKPAILPRYSGPNVPY